MHISVSLAERSYPIYVQTGLLDELGAIIAADYPAGSYAIITDSTVGKLYGSRVRAPLADAGCTVSYHEFEAGEASKNMATVAALCSELARAGHDRTSVVIVLGGGGGGRYRRFCGLNLPARYFMCTDPHHSAGPGGQLGGR
jgi:3-dehydroquinate synthase